MRLVYLGELLQDSYITWCLKKSGKFDRVDHLVRPTLDLTHVSLNPLPDGFVVRCDWEDKELEWAKRYSAEIPKVFVSCDHCIRKTKEYLKLGSIFNADEALRSGDMFLNSLIALITEVI